MTVFRPSGAWPRAWQFALTGLFFGLAAPVWYLVLWQLQTTHAVTVPDAIATIAEHGSVWVTVTIPGLGLLAALGWVLGRREDELVARSLTDSLTGLPNLAGHTACFDVELARAARDHAPLSLLLIDVDRLKAINDQHGHAAGDAALRLVAHALERSCRVTDHAARVGGDEFAVLASGAGIRDSVALAERIRATVEALSATGEVSVACPTVSIGVTDLESAGTTDPELLRASADEALYRAKAAGRDRVAAGARRPGHAPLIGRRLALS